MRKAIALLSIAAMLVFTGVAFAANDLEVEGAQYGGHLWIDVQTGNVVHSEGPEGAALVGGVDIYSNVLSTANAAISSTSLAQVWGDRVTTVGVGILSENDFTIFNGSTSANTLLTANVAINFYNGATSAFIGGYTGLVTFTSPLPGGFYSIVTFVNLETLVTPINLNVNDIVVTQQVTAKTGAATRFGI